MTEPLIILPSMVEKKLRAEIAEKDAEIAALKEQLSKQRNPLISTATQEPEREAPK